MAVRESTASAPAPRGSSPPDGYCLHRARPRGTATVKLPSRRTTRTSPVEAGVCPTRI